MPPDTPIRQSTELLVHRCRVAVKEAEEQLERCQTLLAEAEELAQTERRIYRALGKGGE